MVDGTPTCTRSVPAALTVVILAALGVAWFWNLGGPFSYDYDEGVYLVSARLVLHGHPLFREVFSSQPPLYIELLCAAFRLFGDTVAVGRGVSVVFALATCALLGKASWDAIHPWAAPVAVILCGTALSFFRGARVCQAEMPALGLAMAAIALLANERRACRCVWQVGAGILFGLALSTKLLVAPIALPLMAMIWGSPLSHHPSERRARGCLFLLATAGAVAISIACCFGARDLYRQVWGFHFEARSVVLPWSSTRRLWMDFHLGEGLLAPLAALGMGSLVYRRSSAIIWGGFWLLGCEVFLWLHEPLFSHHLALLVPPLAFLGSAAIALVDLRKRWFAGLATGIMALTLIKAGPTERKWHLRAAPWSWAQMVSPQRADAEERAVARIAQLTSPGSLVATDEQMLAFRADRDVPPLLCDTSFVRIASGSLTLEAALRALADVEVVVLWSGRFSSLPGFIDAVHTRFDLVENAPVHGLPERGIYVARRPSG
jgi:hypothetical protein